MDQTMLSIRHSFFDHAAQVQARLRIERIARAREKLTSLWRLAELAHPEKPLQRGFVIAGHQDRRLAPRGRRGRS